MTATVFILLISAIYPSPATSRPLHRHRREDRMRGIVREVPARRLVILIKCILEPRPKSLEPATADPQVKPVTLVLNPQRQPRREIVLRIIRRGKRVRTVQVRALRQSK